MDSYLRSMHHCSPQSSLSTLVYFQRNCDDVSCLDRSKMEHIDLSSSGQYPECPPVDAPTYTLMTCYCVKRTTGDSPLKLTSWDLTRARPVNARRYKRCQSLWVF